MKNILTSGGEKLGIALSDKQIEQLITYAQLLREWNE